MRHKVGCGSSGQFISPADLFPSTCHLLFQIRFRPNVPFEVSPRESLAGISPCPCERLFRIPPRFKMSNRLDCHLRLARTPPLQNVLPKLLAPDANVRALAASDNWHWATSTGSSSSPFFGLTLDLWQLVTGHQTCLKNSCTAGSSDCHRCQLLSLFFYIKDFRRKCVMGSGWPPLSQTWTPLKKANRSDNQSLGGSHQDSGSRRT